MSQVGKFNNGDQVVNECIFCGGQFEEAQKLGSVIHCEQENGGCGNKFRINIVSNVIKQGSD